MVDRALVTGAASGIGAAVARRLLTDGIDVVATDVNELGLHPIADAGAEVVVADLADLDDRQGLVAAAHGVDYLVNAAGIIRLKSLTDFTVEDWRTIFAINAEATFFLCQGIGPTMPSGGAIVNLSSSAAKLTNTTEAGVYAASKAAVLSVTRSFAYELASIPIRVNALCPGVIDTPMQDAVLAEVAPLRGMTPDELSTARLAGVPLGRAASPNELAGYVRFLLSDEAGYITGQSLNYGGGLVTW